MGRGKLFILVIPFYIVVSSTAFDTTPTVSGEPVFTRGFAGIVRKGFLVAHN
ncbi:hypothetical protein SAMN05720354_12012 [Nitrosospira sp. Nsp1]|nr:hypothetical protein SAMN05720354_12012 [Nitrosospira sp. Nsp1]